MSKSPLTSDEIELLFEEVKSASAACDSDVVRAHIGTLLRAQAEQRDAAMMLLKIASSDLVTPDQCLEIYERIGAAYLDDEYILIQIGEHFSKVVDIDFLNAPPPNSALASQLINKLRALALQNGGTLNETKILASLSSAAKIAGRSFDNASEAAYRRLIEIEPKESRHRYNYGLFLKTRGRFEEGVKENQKAFDLSVEPSDACKWNLGICATGAFKADVALSVWKGIGQKIEIGRFGLPDGSYPSCKVRLAERPLAERDAASNTPGKEETIWIERLSPCHGIIRSVLFEAIGVDYGDVVLFDGAPITQHKYGDRTVPVFPHLSTLVHRNYHFYDFAGTQSESGQINSLTAKLSSDAVVYSHSENLEILCMGCWSDQNLDHEHSDTREMNVVTGRIAAPPEMNADDLLREIDAALPGDGTCRIFSPSLCEAAGLHERAQFERRRYEQLVVV